VSHRDVRLDFERRERLGFDEAILCGSKSAAQIGAILEQAAARDATLLLTRLDTALLGALPAAARARIDYEPVSRTGFFGEVAAARGAPEVAVLTGGTSDVPVGREAVRTLAYYGRASLEIPDVGVAGLWRLLERVDELRKLPAVIAVAGMEGALPSVVAGLVPGVVIAVPTSVGYGVAEGGRTALHANLASCAPGVVVVNIDNGYGAACAALRALRR
jgi:NCAIR mutase (PurE)-related protein